MVLYEDTGDQRDRARLNYLPEYVAREHGIFASHDLDVPYLPTEPVGRRHARSR